MSLDKAKFVIMALAGATLSTEITISRLASFYLNYMNSLIAIPIVLFGLALGSLTLRILPTRQDEYKFLLMTIPLSLSIAFCITFYLFSEYFPVIRHQASVGAILRLGIFCAAFIVPFILAGRTLGNLFEEHSFALDELYAWDLTGAAMGAFLVPITLHFFDMPILIGVILTMGFVAWAMLHNRRNMTAISVFAAVIIFILIGNVFKLESIYDFSGAVALRWSPQSDRSARVAQIAHRWNEYSRVSVLEIESNSSAYHRIVDDNAESNVNVRAFNERPSRPPRGSLYGLPFVLDRNPRDVLVMFAGCGSQMIGLYDAGGRVVNVTGVEINPLVLEFAKSNESLASYRISEFFQEPRIEIEIEEGRNFLERSDRRYDLIFVPSDAATATYKTGHSRKFLDTYEALEEYLSHLRSNGLLIFQGQPGIHKLEALKKIFYEQKNHDIQDHLLFFSDLWGVYDSLIISKTPFSSKEKFAIQRYLRGVDGYLYGPGADRAENDVNRILEQPIKPPVELVTDDRPYLFSANFREFRLIPSVGELRNVEYYRSWIRVLSLIFAVSMFLVFVVLCLAVIRRHAPSRLFESVPTRAIAGLSVTGVGYMLLEIAYIAKLELFLGLSTISMAVVLPTFLLANGMGSAIVSRIVPKASPKLLAIVAGTIILLTTPLQDVAVQYAIGADLSVRVLISVCIVFPPALAVGMFFPVLCSWLHYHKFTHVVPVGFTISAGASVLGAVYGLIIIESYGFSNAILQAAAFYVVSMLLLPSARAYFGHTKAA